jgi:hypothetical protein
MAIKRLYLVDVIVVSLLFANDCCDVLARLSKKIFIKKRWWVRTYYFTSWKMWRTQAIYENHKILKTAWNPSRSASIVCCFQSFSCC